MSPRITQRTDRLKKWRSLNRGSRRLALFFVMAVAASVVVTTVLGAGGNIHPAAIEIDVPSANLYPTAAGSTDWVKDSLANTDGPSLNNSIAVGVIPGVTGAVATGHWNGVRIVDGVGGNDQDIFLQGGKENEVTTWNVGPGSIGSSKYDITQAYLANNNSTLFFGMERRGNNGTTAFDFEFNVKAPDDPACAAHNPSGNQYIPCRSVGDVLFTFEMQGSGGSGSAMGFYYQWVGPPTTGHYEQLTTPSSLISSINQAEVPAAPWGYVDSKGVWVNGNIPRFEFAEAKVNIVQAFPGVTSSCGKTFYTQVRTRSSSTANSDLKDTTKTFPFSFGGPTAAATASTSCPSTQGANTTFTYDGSASTNADGTSAGLTYAWDIQVSPASVTLTGGGVSADGTTAGLYHSSQPSGTVTVDFSGALSSVNSATITVKNTVSESSCPSEQVTDSVTVYRPLNVTADLTESCGLSIGFSSTVTGGKAPYTYDWKFYKDNGPNPVASSSSASGTFSPAAAGSYHAVLTVTDSADTDSGKAACAYVFTTDAVQVYTAVGVEATLTADCDDTFGYSASGSGGLAPYDFSWQIQRRVSVNPEIWNTVHTFTDPDKTTSSGVLDIDDFGGVDGRYRAVVMITDSQALACPAEDISNEIDVAHALTTSASKTGFNRANLSATLTGVATAGSSLQWQRYNGSTWVNINLATSDTLTYSSFESDATPTDVDHAIDGFNYKGRLWSVQLRLHVSKLLNGQTCEKDSDPVTVKMVKSVDP